MPVRPGGGRHRARESGQDFLTGTKDRPAGCDACTGPSTRFERDATPRANTRKEGCGHMTIDQATELIRHTLVLALIVSAPMLIIGLGVGIVVSLLQAVTQIQEQTLTFIPKITAMFAAAILLLPWIGHRLIEYTSAMLLNGQIP